MTGADPFLAGLFGGLPKTATSASETSTGGTTARANPRTSRTSLSVQVTNSSSEAERVTRHSRGAIRSTGATASKASSATYSAMKARTSRRSLSDRLTLSLISAGLVCGITPSSTRKQSGAEGAVRVFAFARPVGRVAAAPTAACSSLSEKPGTSPPRASTPTPRPASRSARTHAAPDAALGPGRNP